jgi:alginate O-acetyltransferase complex protein AlgI
MLFNSVEFAFFFPIVFFLYWFVTQRSLRLQNLLLLISSYFFYGCWDWRFLFLLIFSTLLDFYTGLKMQDASNREGKKFWFWLSILVNVGFLGVFKYYNFFIGSFAEVFTLFGVPFQPATLSVILPVGISFYTFHGLSYVIDIYYDRIPAERNYIDYAVFVSFFPLLVAGPIERATHLLPQIKVARRFEYQNAISGLRQILLGLFKKIVIADTCAPYANQAFENCENLPPLALAAGIFYFGVQIYGDFSGYSDVALGSARLLGIELLKNFDFPYFSRNPFEFWKRWHISLTSWFRDYVYIPLGGNRLGKGRQFVNVVVIFLVSGLWHGANWTFVAWGALHALFYLPFIFVFKVEKENAKGGLFPSISEFIGMVLTFGFTLFAWIFFRAQSMGQAFGYIKGFFSSQWTSIPKDIGSKYWFATLAAFWVFEWLQYRKIIPADKFPVWVRWPFYLLCTFMILYYISQNKSKDFIYFQF